MCLGRIDWYSESTAGPLGSIVVEDFLQDVAIGFSFVQHGQLQSFLMELTKQEGVTFRFDSKVSSADSESGFVTLHTGERLYADIIIGADGYNSVFRPLVTGELEDNPNPEKILILAFNIPLNDLKNDPELETLLDPSLWSFWMSEGQLVHGHFINGERDYTIIISHQYDGPLKEDFNQDWEVTGDITQYSVDFGKMEPRIKKLIGYATVISSRIVVPKLGVESLVCENSRIILVGDAAHPMLPSGHQSQALAFEDAQTLGCLFSRIQRKDQVSQLLTAYNEIRQPRSAFAVLHSNNRQATLKAKEGPLQEGRDRRMRAILIQMEGDHMDETLFKEVWGDELTLFAYDAKEKVDDWWGQWGSFIVQNPNRKSILSCVPISISEDTKSEET